MSKSAAEQVVNGFWLVVRGAACLVTLGLLIDGERRVAQSLMPVRYSLNSFMGLGELFLACSFLWKTASTWSPWVTAVTFFVALRSVVGLAIGRIPSPPFTVFPRIFAFETIVFLVCAGLLSIRFMSRSPSTFDRIALLTFVLAASIDLLFEPAHIAIATGLFALIVAWTLSDSCQWRRHTASPRGHYR